MSLYFLVKDARCADQKFTRISEYKDRVELIKDRQKKTSILRLHNITENDKRAYCFRFVTEIEGNEKDW